LKKFDVLDFAGLSGQIILKYNKRRIRLALSSKKRCEFPCQKIKVAPGWDVIINEEVNP